MLRNAVVVGSVVSAVFLLACAKTVVDSVPDPETNKNATVPAPAKDAGAKDSSTTKKPPVDNGGEDEQPAPTGGQCANETSFDTCLDCCATAHEDGANTFYGTYIDCLCTAACATECSASLCDTANPTAPDAACDACISANGTMCQSDVAAACSADPDCIAFDKCVGDSDCENKP
jgi:hypothetical protein